MLTSRNGQQSAISFVGHNLLVRGAFEAEIQGNVETNFILGQTHVASYQQNHPWCPPCKSPTSLTLLVPHLGIFITHLHLLPNTGCSARPPAVRYRGDR